MSEWNISPRAGAPLLPEAPTWSREQTVTRRVGRLTAVKHRREPRTRAKKQFSDMWNLKDGGEKKKMIHGGAHWMRAGAAGFPAHVCIIHFPSMSHESWPLTCSCACARLSVAACYPPSAPPHVGRDPRWWIRAGTNLLVHLWNKNQGEKEQAEGPHHTRIRLPPDTTWHFTPLMTHTHAHTHTYVHVFSLDPPCSRFSFPEKAQHNTEHCSKKNQRAT